MPTPTNVASAGTHDQCGAVLAAGALPAFVELLGSPSEDVREVGAIKLKIRQYTDRVEMLSNYKDAAGGEGGGEGGSASGGSVTSPATGDR